MPKGIFVRTKEHNKNVSVSLKKFWNNISPIENRVCKIGNCNKKHYSRRYCQNHYMQLYFYPSHKKHCSEYQKKYRLEKYGIGNRIKPCQFKKCKNKTNMNHKLCSYHNQVLERRKKTGLPLDLSIDCRHLRKGNKNNLWKGGVAEYPNHYLMKKNRLIILLHNPICEICKEKPAIEVHHKNGVKSDHRLSNLVASCRKCNAGIRFKPNTSKYRRLYGINMEEIIRKLHIPMYIFYKLHNQDKLKELLNNG